MPYLSKLIRHQGGNLLHFLQIALRIAPPRGVVVVGCHNTVSVLRSVYTKQKVVQPAGCMYTRYGCFCDHVKYELACVNFLSPSSSILIIKAPLPGPQKVFFL
jgi:hypothetical protein